MLRVFLVLALLPVTAAAQGLQVAFAGLDNTADQPVEIAADSMSINQDDGIATLTGNVVVGQGDMRMAAQRILIIYTQDGGVSRFEATGGVTVVTPEEEVEAASATYNLDEDTMLLSGDVLLSQGQSAVSAERMRVNMDDGTALLEGRVRTVLQPNSE
ncbi:MAG: LptA/OstA family protein [Pseudomonadota bacterium]